MRRWIARTSIAIASSADSANGSRADNSALYENLEALHAGWTQFVHGIDDDLQGLERAIAQARQDKLLREEERARTEQETSAEIKRLQEGNRQRSLEETDPDRLHCVQCDRIHRRHYRNHSIFFKPPRSSSDIVLPRNDRAIERCAMSVILVLARASSSTSSSTQWSACFCVLSKDAGSHASNSAASAITMR